MTLETESSSNNDGRSSDTHNSQRHSQHHLGDRLPLKDTWFARAELDDTFQGSPPMPQSNDETNNETIVVKMTSSSNESSSSFSAKTRRNSSSTVTSFRLSDVNEEENEKDKEDNDVKDGDEIYGSSELHTTLQRRRNSSGTRTTTAWEVRQVDLNRNTVTSLQRSCKAVLDGLTVNKLQFDKVGLHGREEETKQLIGVWDSVYQKHVWLKQHGQKQSEEREEWPQRQEQHMNTPPSVPTLDSDDTSTKRTTLVNNKVLTIVEGLSGVGKSRLVSDVLKKQVQRKRAYFVVGKFDMKQFDEPFKGIIMAMEDLCDQLLCDLPVDPSGSFYMTPESLDSVDIKELLHQTLKLELPFLVTIFPKLMSLASCDCSVDESDMSDNGNQNVTCDNSQPVVVEETAAEGIGTINIKANADRLKHCFRKFIQIICSVSPLVIHLDDTHWADQESMDLLYQILTDTSNRDALMVVCSYRSNEMRGEHHPMTTLIDRISTFTKEKPIWSVPVHTITVHNLSVEAINSFLQDLLSGGSNETMKLAQVLYDKTRGNIFFANQVLISLHKQGLLEYNIGIGKWIWDAQKILEQAPPGDNVVDLVKEKLLRDTEAMQLLAIAAYLGSHFSRANLIMVVEGIRAKSTDSTRKINKNDRLLYSLLPLDFDVNALIHHCHQEEYIQPLATNDGFHFLHDRIQEAALSVLPDLVFFSLKYEVGRVLLAKLPEDQLESMVFVVLGLLSDGNRRPSVDQEEKMAFLKLYKLAGHRAASFSAFTAASKHFQSAIELLPDDCWKSHYELTLDLFSSAAEAEYTVANFKSMTELCYKILNEPSVSPTNKLRVTHILIDTAVIKHKPRESMQVARSLLKNCGVNIPPDDLRITLSAVLGLARTKFSKKMQNPDTIAKLPLTNITGDAQIMKTLDHLATAAYVGNNPEFFTVVVLKSIHYTFNHGITIYSPAAFALIGLLLSCFIDDFAAGWKFASNGLAMLKRVKCKDVESRTIFVSYTYCAHWIMPMKNCMKHLLQGYKIGLSTGDLMSATFCAHFWSEYALYTGMPLADLDSNMTSYAEQMKDFGQAMVLLGHKMVHQVVQILRGKAGHNDGTGIILSGDVMDQEETLNELSVANDEFMMLAMQRYRLILACYIGDYENGASLAMQCMDKCCKALPGQPATVMARFCSSICYYAMARKTRKRRYLQEAKRQHKFLRSWSDRPKDKINPNFVHREVLLSAELDAFRGKIESAFQKYEVAIRMAGRSGIVQDQALTNERYAALCLEQGNHEEYYFRMNAAICLYSEWGASAKVQKLRSVLKP
ncbi:multi-sensor signal transduction multi-kinase [Nitzschia inconspicua]|uniref:Multi-sensor signal transduction multi-kinase n=1 Tax=Nitzschia inconspicua TaxID=303405 RepID=A0A9K3KIG1_9STRA|nr:multi-sensor signal transduction multi-kinase [Nitzschia inconspicua]